jgi:protein-S-isoprenylcysteine O-methyltransferase Ste14
MSDLYNLVLFLWLGSEALIFVTHVTRAGDPRDDRFSGIALVGSIVMAMFLSARLARAAPAAGIPDGGHAVFLFGIALALLGIALRWFAVVSLGRFFTMRVMVQSGQSVVERGPYRLVRHPSYTGMLVTVLGMLLASTNWLSLTCFLIPLPGLAYRIKVEEGALLGALGDPYREYMRRTKRLVPFVV